MTLRNSSQLARREDSADELFGDFRWQLTVGIRKRRPTCGNSLPVLREVALAVGTGGQVALELEAVGPREFAHQEVADERRELATGHGCVSHPERMATIL